MPAYEGSAGTEAAVKNQSINMAEEMLSREIFMPDHYVFYQKNGGRRLVGRRCGILGTANAETSYNLWYELVNR